MVHLHYDKTWCFLVRLAGFMNMIFFVRDQIANTNAKMPRFHCNVNEPLERRVARTKTKAKKQKVSRRR